MSDKIEYSRLLLKRSNTAGVVPTVPPITATTLNQFTPTDLFVGEMFANVEDDRAWIRTNNGIIEFNFTGSTGSGSTVIPTLTQVLNSGNTTGGFDILFPSGSKPVYTGLASGGTSQYLGLDASGNTIIVTGATGGSGTSGTSGTNGSSGTSGISGLGLFLPLSGGTVTGNTYFGSTSGITLDQANSRLGIRTSTPQHTIEAFGTKSKITYEDTSGGVFQISGDTFLPRLSVAGAPSVTKPLFSMSMGVRTYDDVTFPGYGKVGDGHLYASNEMNGLNIINRQGTGTTEDYIRFYAGNDANGTIPDIHIQGSGATKGFVGINTIDPQTELHVSGMTTLDGRVYIKQITSGGSSTYLTIDSDTGQLYTAQGVSGGTGSSGTSGSSGSSGISGSSGTSGSSGVGQNGSSGTSGLSGVNGTNGSSGISGTNGSSGTSGVSAGLGLHFGYPYVAGQLGMITWGEVYGIVNPDFMEARVMAYPVVPTQDIDYSAFTIDQSGTQLGANARIVLYDNDPTDLYPRNMIYSSSTIDLYGGGGCCRIHNALTTGTLSGGTVYWLGVAFSGVSGGSVTLNQYAMTNLWNISRPTVADGFGVVYKYAVSQTFTNFNSLPSTFQKQSTISFNGSWVHNGYFGGTNAAPAVYVKFAT